MVRRIVIGFVALTVAGLALLAPTPQVQADELAGPTAAQLKARAGGCETQLSNGKYAQDSGGSRTVAVCKSGDAVHWTADFDVDCDGQRTTQCNENTDPSFQPNTSWNQSDGRPLNAAGLPFIVVPLSSTIWNFRNAGINGATIAAVVYQDKVAYAVVGDQGPTGIIGEGSYKLAQQLGINPNPSSGGVSGAVVTYILFPGISAVPIENQTDATAKGQTAATAFVNNTQTCASTNLDLTAYPALQAGSTGGAVRAAQCLLGGTNEPSGTYDTATTDAVKAFQTRVGLPSDGLIGAKTWTALLAAGDQPTIRNGSTGTAVSRLQRSLTAALGRTVIIDGQFGPATETAAEDYQRTRALIVDGVVGPVTWTALQAGK
ncbi:peptidoglycan-binding protein [Kribbella antibiotica]|uniref:Peptidoglycan-binding protein n=1 Tax=Kribbella antibiotica TaxID=190195 RepID=A0A4R4ZTU9_9ACTN|nr:glycoside hydrolase family 75 protein [Kribbella antibiotica]TDD61766.1 peptidoglycan-binding protein [Kribbella antibiotica]